MFLLAFSVAIFWVIVTLLDAVFKSCTLPLYLKLLEGGLNVRPGCLQWNMTRWNQTFQRWRKWKPMWQTCWFNIGSAVSCALLPLASLILLKTVVGFLSLAGSGDQQNKDVQLLQPVLPGVNVPLSDAAYYFLTLLFCSVIHEVGHAISAAREDVSVLGVSLFLMGIFPGAFVELPTEQVVQCTPCQRLRIFCAGVWHNLALVVLCAGLLWTTPVLLTPGYAQGHGLAVIDISPSSGLSGPAGLSLGDIIINVSDCRVLDSADWIACLLPNEPHPPAGYCATEQFIETEGFILADPSAKVESCCPPNDAAGLCFTLDMKPLIQRCLPVRKLLESGPSFCNSSVDCSSSEMCVKPLLANDTLLLELQRINKKPVLFLGSPAFLAQSVKLSPFIPRSFLCPIILPYIWETQLKYLIAFSSALALLNVVPCYGLDGYHILSAMLDLLGLFSRHRRKKLLQFLTLAGSLLLGTSVALAGYMLFQR